RLSHANIVSVVDFGESSGLLYLAMDFVEGSTLSSVRARERVIDQSRALAIARQLAEALHHAHERGVIHRDLKPQNVMLLGSGRHERAVVLDFGVAKLQSTADLSKLTATGMLIGTPSYMSPEQALGAEIDQRSDLFSLGIVLFEMLAGR